MNTGSVTFRSIIRQHIHFCRWTKIRHSSFQAMNQICISRRYYVYSNSDKCSLFKSSHDTEHASNYTIEISCSGKRQMKSAIALLCKRKQLSISLRCMMFEAESALSTKSAIYCVCMSLCETDKWMEALVSCTVDSKERCACELILSNNRVLAFENVPQNFLFK